MFAFMSASPQPLAIIAPAAGLGLTLGGPLRPYYSQWTGPGISRIGSADIQRALYGYNLIMLLLFGDGTDYVTGGFFLARGGGPERNFS